ncbi:stress enhanced protein 1, chloroplastic-like [Andrographis paniculata]|uniref:stress enhanced protein 1, chloroplastic-like n=1 Tax=Andrographis paniculata TaxID=175694 RepID=UPI0021E6F237|nr:stress enhanced protein 1, chloroplastic-like [Andrographis paniculata]
MAAAASISLSSSLCCHCSTICHVRASTRSKNAYAARGLATVFETGSPLSIQKSFWRRSNCTNTSTASKSKAVSIRCEQSSKESGSNNSGFDVWVGRVAMVSFGVAISVEIATGKGLLENFGFTTPLPTVALAATTLAGVLVAVFIFQSASKT